MHDAEFQVFKVHLNTLNHNSTCICFCSLTMKQVTADVISYQHKVHVNKTHKVNADWEQLAKCSIMNCCLEPQSNDGTAICCKTKCTVSKTQSAPCMQISGYRSEHAVLCKIC